MKLKDLLKELVDVAEKFGDVDVIVVPDGRNYAEYIDEVGMDKEKEVLVIQTAI